MRLLLSSVALFSLLILGCNSQDEFNRNGDVQVAIELPSGDISGWEVGTIPRTKVASTNDKGKARINNIPQGVYELYARHPTLGYGSITRTVFEDKTNNVTIRIPSSTPQIQLVFPLKISNFIFGETIIIKANIFDDKDSGSDLKIELESSKDGLLFSDFGSDDGKFEYTYSNLELGTYEMTLRVTDSEDNETTLSFIMNIEIDTDLLEIDSCAVNQEGVYVRWSKNFHPDLISYDIYRGYNINNLSKIDQKEDVNSNFIFDTSVEVNREVYYIIKYVFPADVYETEIKSVFYKGNSIDIDIAGIKSMISNPVSPFIYAIDKVNSRLMFINVEESEVEEFIDLVDPISLTINTVGDRLYVVTKLNSLYGKIVEIDLISRTVIREIELTDMIEDQIPFQIEWLKGNKIALLPDEFVNNLHILNLDTEEFDYIGPQISRPTMTSNSKKDKLYVVRGSSSSGINIDKFRSDDNSFVLELQGYDEDGFIDDPVVSGNNNRLFIGNRRYSVSNLNTSTKISPTELVLASNYTGSRIAFNQGIYDINLAERIELYGFIGDEVISNYNHEEIIVFNNERKLLVIFKLDE